MDFGLGLGSRVVSLGVCMLMGMSEVSAVLPEKSQGAQASGPASGPKCSAVQDRLKNVHEARELKCLFKVVAGVAVCCSRPLPATAFAAGHRQYIHL